MLASNQNARYIHESFPGTTKKPLLSLAEKQYLYTSCIFLKKMMRWND